MPKLIDSSAIKLFGKTIPLLKLNQKQALADDHELSCERNFPISSPDSLGGVNSDDKDQAQAPREDQESIGKEFFKEKHEDSKSHQIREDLNDPITVSGITDNAPTSPLAERKSISSLESSKNEQKSDHQTNASQEKTSLKKPDKILPCPRCHSKETKFCYYNNYNVNQPRHFCKNCQRYWTAGGTMRNVPVGSGRRKTKSSSALQYHHIVISEAIKATQASVANGIHQNPSCENNNNIRVITFGSDPSLPVASVLNLPGKTQIKNGFQKPDERRILVEDNHHSGESLITASYSIEKEGKVSRNQAEDKNSYQWFPCKVPVYPPPYQWFPPPGFPVSFHPAPMYPNYNVPSPWDVPVASPSPSSVNQCAPRTSPSTSRTLGKHSRDGNIILSNNTSANLEKKMPSEESNKSEGTSLNSKTLRIDDPGEPEKSSMLATLLVKSKKTDSINSGGLFEGFRSKISHDRNFGLETLSVLQANPAALSRSFKFHENT